MKSFCENTFINKASNVHNNKYIYDNINYINSRIKINITCPLHGNFSQKPHKHLNGQGCPTCSNNIDRNKDLFINRAKEIHNNKYCYSLVCYKNQNSKVKIICNNHDLPFVFEQKPNNHLNNKGCQKCSKNFKINTDEFINLSNKVHNNSYNYTLTNYINAKSKVKIICNN